MRGGTVPAHTHSSAVAAPCLTGGLSQAAGLAAQQPIPVAELITGKHRFVKYQHKTSKTLFTQARS